MLYLQILHLWLRNKYSNQGSNTLYGEALYSNYQVCDPLRTNDFYVKMSKICRSKVKLFH